MLELRGGFLWRTRTGTTEEQESGNVASEVPPLILASTGRLLERLALLHDHDDENNEGSLEDDDTEEIVAVVTEDETDPKQKRTKKEDRESTSTPPELKRLIAVHPRGCLADLIIISLQDIYKFHQRDCSDSGAHRNKDKRLDFEQSRLLALEHQRDRLQQKKQQQEQAQEQQLDKVTSEQNREDAWLRLARSLNSLAIVTPLLQNMLYHKHRNNQNIRLGDVTLTGNNKKSQCWLFGDKVFDVTTTTRCKSIDTHLSRLYEFMNVTKSGGDITDERVRKEVLERTMHSLAKAAAAYFSTEKLSLEDESSWWKPPEMFFTELSQLQRQKLEKLLPSIDDRFDLLLGRNESELGEHAQYLKSINNLRRHLASMLESRFSGSRLSIYGSCLSDLSLGKAADVDLSLYVPELQRAKQNYESGHVSVKNYQDTVKKIVYSTVRCIENGPHKNKFCKMVPVTRARVAVVKGTLLAAGNPHSSDGSIDFDICFLNEIAVANSELLRQYSLVDARAKALILAVKQWAKTHNLCSAQDNYLSSYAWVNLTVFYMQCIGLVPNLQCPELRMKAGVAADPDRNEWHKINNLDTFFLTWEQVKAVWSPPATATNDWQMSSLVSLLYGFFAFYSRSIPGNMAIVSIKRGKNCRLPKSVFRKISFFLCIEDPFETHDSHMPHDLASPVSETAARRIVHCLREAEEHLRTVLLRACDCDGGEEDILRTTTSLWPHPPTSRNTNGNSATFSNTASQGRKDFGANRNNIHGKQKHQPKPIVKKGTPGSMPASQDGTARESAARINDANQGDSHDKRGGNSKKKQPPKHILKGTSVSKPGKQGGGVSESSASTNVGNPGRGKAGNKQNKRAVQPKHNGGKFAPKPGTGSSGDIVHSQGSGAGTRQQTPKEKSNPLTGEISKSTAGGAHRSAEPNKQKGIRNGFHGRAPDIAPTDHLCEETLTEDSVQVAGQRKRRNNNRRKWCFVCREHGHVKANCPTNSALDHDRSKTADTDHLAMQNN